MTAPVFEISTQRRITAQEISDLLVTAFEGGSNYWISGIHYTMPEKIEFLPDNAMNPKAQPRYAYVPLNEGGSILIKGDGMSQWKILNLASIAQGLKHLEQEQHSRHLADLVNDNADAETADVFLQLCCFGEIIYG